MKCCLIVVQDKNVCMRSVAKAKELSSKLFKSGRVLIVGGYHEVGTMAVVKKLPKDMCYNRGEFLELSAEQILCLPEFAELYFLEDGEVRAFKRARVDVSDDMDALHTEAAAMARNIRRKGERV